MFAVFIKVSNIRMKIVICACSYRYLCSYRFGRILITCKIAFHLFYCVDKGFVYIRIAILHTVNIGKYHFTGCIVFCFIKLFAGFIIQCKLELVFFQLLCIVFNCFINAQIRRYFRILNICKCRLFFRQNFAITYIICFCV